MLPVEHVLVIYFFMHFNFLPGIRAFAGIAFSVVLTSDVPHMTEHQPIVYDKVLLNDGNGYNPSSGIFTCPVRGVYLFMYHLGVQDLTNPAGVQTWIHLTINGHAQNSATADTTESSQELQGSNSAIVQLSQGDTVWVETYLPGHSNSLYGHQLLNTFSGVLLY